MSLRGLRKSYGATPVLTGVDLHVTDGEYLVLVGPSGCGKSTLLRCIAGLESITAGDLFIGDRRVNDVAAKDRDIAMVFQSYALYPHLTVRDNLGFALKLRRTPKEEIARRVADVAAQLDLAPLLDRLPAQLSGGQRQRVAMGRAIVRHPQVFLFDEPLSNLDAALRDRVRLELKRLHRKLRATVFHVTHDQVEALTLADRILVLDRGVVQQIGTPQEVYDAPANTFVAGFIGSPAMNLLPARGDGKSVRIEGMDEALPGERTGDFLLGVRPADVALDGGPLAGVVDVVENLGGEALVHVRAGARDLVARVPGTTAFAAGMPVAMRFSKVHAFHRELGTRLP